MFSELDVLKDVADSTSNLAILQDSHLQSLVKGQPRLQRNANKVDMSKPHEFRDPVFMGLIRQIEGGGPGNKKSKEVSFLVMRTPIKGGARMVGWESSNRPIALSPPSNAKPVWHFSLWQTNKARLLKAIKPEEPVSLYTLADWLIC